jgi:type I restriction-modification system DNA methylase subunit
LVNASSKGKIVLDKQSDIYIYFFIHGLAFLRNNGRLGFIASNKWLEVEYGEAFQEFLLKNCKIETIMEFDRAVFADADVNTAVVVLQKESEAKVREENTVKFVRVKARLDTETILKLVNETEASFEDDKIRINVVKTELLAYWKMERLS